MIKRESMIPIGARETLTPRAQTVAAARRLLRDEARVSWMPTAVRLACGKRGLHPELLIGDRVVCVPAEIR